MLSPCSLIFIVAITITRIACGRGCAPEIADLIEPALFRNLGPLTRPSLSGFSVSRGKRKRGMSK
jgi:hypothetical protein